LESACRVWFFVVSSVLVGFAAYMMTPEERVRALATLRKAAFRFVAMAQGGAPSEPFGKALTERTRWPLVAPAFGLGCVVVSFSIALGIGAPSGAEGLIAWGGNIGPRTTNGEWHRLLASVFVHPHLFDLVMNLAGLAAFGLIAERLIGPAAFATVCVSAALAASLVSLSLDPLRLSFGASGAVLGIYGMLVSAAVRVFLATRAPLVPWHIAKPLVPVAAVFLLYTLAAPSMAAKAELTALLVGVLSGVVLTKGIHQGKPSITLSGRVVAATTVATLAAAFMLRGIDDGRLEVAAVTALEERTARQYETEVDRYRNGSTTAEQLIRMIETAIVPELQAAQSRIDQLDRVPDEQRPSIDHTHQYLRQRTESWRLRVDGLRQRSFLEARQAGRKLPPSAPRLSPTQLLEQSSVALLHAEGIERNALKDLRAAAAILQ
jgi:membrane associated rhomboid family serine protease